MSTGVPASLPPSAHTGMAPVLALAPRLHGPKPAAGREPQEQPRRLQTHVCTPLALCRRGLRPAASLAVSTQCVECIYLAPSCQVNKGGLGGGGDFVGGGNFMGKFRLDGRAAKFPPRRNLGVAAGAGAHARSQPACPPRAAWGEWGAFISPWPWWALRECCLGGRTVRPPWRSPRAALRRLQPVARPALGTAHVLCPILPPSD